MKTHILIAVASVFFIIIGVYRFLFMERIAQKMFDKRGDEFSRKFFLSKSFILSHRIGGVIAVAAGMFLASKLF